jgi:CRP-like cAMP-binding protein
MENRLFDFISAYIPLSKAEKEALIDLDLFKFFPKGTVLLAEGQSSRQGYFVLSGCLRTYYLIDGEEKTTEFFTEMTAVEPACVITQQPSEYYVACVEDALLLVSNPDMEAVIFEKFPRFETLCRMFSEERLAKNQVQFDRFKTSSPEQRYLTFLEARPDLAQRVPQHQIASYLGMKPQSLSRIRARLARKQA